jgi:hypothetical protein
MKTAKGSGKMVAMSMIKKSDKIARRRLSTRSIRGV